MRVSGTIIDCNEQVQAVGCRNCLPNLRNAPEQGDRIAGGFQPNLVIGHLGFDHQAILVHITLRGPESIGDRLHDLLERHPHPLHGLRERTPDQWPLENRVRFLLRSRRGIAGIFGGLDPGFALDQSFDESSFPFIERLFVRACHLPNPHLKIISK